MDDVAFKRDSFFKRNLTIIAPALVFIVFFIIGGILFRNFFTLRVLLNLLTNIVVTTNVDTNQGALTDIKRR